MLGPENQSRFSQLPCGACWAWFHMTVEGFCFGQSLPTHHTKVSRFGTVLSLLEALGTL